MSIRTIDINCDVGEGVGNEAELFPLISSCNIACGAHAGSKETVRLCLKLAHQYNVNIGAHPSYPDKKNFGRVSMDISDDDLKRSIKVQMNLILHECELLNLPLHHIKPHGALYNDIAKNEVMAKVFLEAILPYKRNVFLNVPFGSTVEKLAISMNFKIKREAFADRNYNNDLSLVSRKLENALILKGEEVLQHILLMYNEKLVKTVNGNFIPIQADTYCIHGDTPAASRILAYITEHLSEHNLQTK